MEWVETTGRTIDEAKDRALDLLGVDEADAEFEIVEHPKIGFLGRVKSLARVRARVRPAVPRPKTERRDRKRRGEGRSGRSGRREGGQTAPAIAATTTVAERETTTTTVSGEAAGTDGEGRERGAEDKPAAAGEAGSAASAKRRRRRRRSRSKRRTTDTATAGSATTDTATTGGDDKGATMPELSLEEQGRLVASFMDGLVDAFGLEATSSWELVGDDTVEVRVEGPNLGLLVGPKGNTLQAVTEVARSIVVRHGEGSSAGRLSIDVAGYRQRRREALQRFTRDVATQVLETGKPRALEPMTPADRKIVHDTVNEIEGVVSTSEGDEPNRRVVISPT
ncbi:MAG TPA: R3H domain-containing nucleic acid-binding protein [Acidimicrobiales bacterium]